MDLDISKFKVTPVARVTGNLKTPSLLLLRIYEDDNSSTVLASITANLWVDAIVVTAGFLILSSDEKIGRASCRERVI